MVFYSCKKENNDTYTTTSGPGNAPTVSQSLRQIPVESGRGCQGDPCAYTTAKDLNDAQNLGMGDLDLGPAYAFRDNILEPTLSGPAYIACFYDVSKVAADEGMISASTIGQWYDLLREGLQGAQIMNANGLNNTIVITNSRYQKATAMLQTFKPYSSHPSITEQLEILDDVLQDMKGKTKSQVLAYLDVD